MTMVVLIKNYYFGKIMQKTLKSTFKIPIKMSVIEFRHID